MVDDNKTILDFNDYPDIDLKEFDEWFWDKYLSKLKLAEQGLSSINYFKDKYNVEWWFHRDVENNQFSIELKLIEVNHDTDPEFEKMLEEQLSKINHNTVNIDELKEELNLEDIPKINRCDHVKFTKTYY